MTGSSELEARIGGRMLRLANLGRVLHPETGFTQGRVVESLPKGLSD